MDFSTPSVKQVSNFFMYLYQHLNRLPSTIDGYRTAIVDTLGPAGLDSPQSSDLNRLLSLFHRDRPKVPRIFLSRTFLSSLKHLLSLWKTQTSNILPSNCFLAIFGLRQAPQRNSCLGCKQSIYLGQWEKVGLFPSSDFLAKNQPAR